MLGKFLLAALGLLSLTGVAPPVISKPPSPTISTPQPIAILNKIEQQPKDLGWTDQQGVFSYGTQAIDDQCKAQPVDLWCGNAPLREKVLTAWEIAQISIETKTNFVYKSDVTDNWRVHSSQVMDKKMWFGDCDDLASTTLDMLIRAGQPRNRAWLVLADVEHKASLDHLVAMVQDDAGHFWIVGDTAAQTFYPADRSKYRWVAVARMDNARAWQDPHFVGAFAAVNLQSKAIIPEAQELKLNIIK